MSNYQRDHAHAGCDDQGGRPHYRIHSGRGGGQLPAQHGAAWGGTRTTPASAGSLKPIASYPTFHNAAHNFGHKAAADGEINPDSWAAVGLNGGGSGTVPNSTYAYAICSQLSAASGVTVTVRSHEVSGPTTATSSQKITTSCGSADGTLISGGAAISSGNLATTDFTAPGSHGDHFNGSFPSDATGAPVGNGTTTAASWTAFTHTGGADSPRTFSDVWALCMHTNSRPAPNPGLPPVSIPGTTPAPGSTTIPGSATVPGASTAPGWASTSGSTTTTAPTSGATATMMTLTVIAVPLPLGLGGVAIPIAQVAPADAAGTVQSHDGSANLGEPMPVVTGMAIGPICVLHSGSHSLTAVFSSTNPTNVQPLTSNTVTLTF
ncbi:MAG TPA: hypothetical protein VE673_08500 [Pseudonocardiaceae bacterium]|nr:hypothetical protein [Pseudonocardiaceae bacterium]